MAYEKSLRRIDCRNVATVKILLAAWPPLLMSRVAVKMLTAGLITQWLHFTYIIMVVVDG